MHNYIYELLQVPVPADEWTKAWEYHEHPDAFPIADIVEDAKDRSGVIARFGAWLKENRLGELAGRNQGHSQSLYRTEIRPSQYFELRTRTPPPKARSTNPAQYTS